MKQKPITFNHKTNLSLQRLPLTFSLKILITFLMFMALTGLSAQKRYTISGYVRENSSKELLPGVNIYVPSLKLGAITNNYGFYSLSLPEGEYDIIYSYVGYEASLQKIKLTGNVTVDVNLNNSTLSEVVISGSKAEKVSETTQISMVSIPVSQIKDIPSLLGEKDVFKALQLMPGVQKGSEGSSGLYVRGGGPDQNLIILDDAPVYNASHLFGFFSIFNGDALKSIELTKGGFPARFGGRLSSVVEMTMKDGNKQKLSGEAGIGIISSRILLEGPIKKDVSSFIISGRRTYIDVLMQPFIGDGSEKAGYYFYDLNAKVSHDLSKSDRIYISGYFGRDKFYFTDNWGNGYKEKAGLYWQNATATVRWNHLFTPKVFANASFIFSRYNMKIYNEDKSPYHKYSLEYISGIRDFSFKYDLENSISPYYQIRTGISLINHRFSPSAIVEIDDQANTNTNKRTLYESLEGGAYIENHFTNKENLKANAGFRYSNLFVGKKIYHGVEPRLVVNYKLLPNLSVKAGYAEMNQYIHLLSNTGIGLPTDLWVPSTERVKPQHSRQYSAGIAKDFANTDFTVTVEGYYKKSKRIVGYKPGANFLGIDDPTSAEEFTWEDNVTQGTGKSYGTEFLIHKKSGRFSGWIGYTLSWTKLQFDDVNHGKEFWAKYDRRHDLSVVGIYKITPKVTFSTTWVYGTGNAITMPLGDYPAAINNPLLAFSGMLGHSVAIPSQYDYVNDYGGLNSSRMKPYHRLDLAVQFIKKKERYERRWELGLYNAYSRKNPFYYFIDNNSETQKTVLKQVSIFPAVPSVTYSIKF